MHDIRMLQVLGLGLVMASMAGGCGDDSDGSTPTTSDPTAGSATMTGGDTTTGPTGGDPTGGTDPTGSAETEDTGGTGELTCPEVPTGDAAEGDACTANADCMSGLCLLFQDVPADDDAVCGAAPADCATRITGTVRDLTTGDPVGSASVRVAAALSASLNPTGAEAVVEATTDADGTIDVTSDGPIMEQIGLVSLVDANGFYLTATGVGAPLVDGEQDYAPGNTIHDLWAVPEASLTEWSTALGASGIDGELLPLGDEGGVIGLVRDASTGDALAGVEIVPIDPESDASVRYLQDDDSFTDTETGSSGIFVILEPALAEEFDAQIDGSSVVSSNGSAGSAQGAAFTLVFNATP